MKLWSRNPEIAWHPAAQFRCRKTTRPVLSCQFRKYVRYSVSLCAGLNPASRI